MPTDPQSLSLDLYAQLLQARDRLDDLLPVTERACAHAETLALSSLQATDTDPRPLMLVLSQVQTHLDGLNQSVHRAVTLQTALCVDQATVPRHAPPRPLQQAADAILPLAEAVSALRRAVGTGSRRLDQQARAAQALLLHLTQTLRTRPLTDADLAPLRDLCAALQPKPDALQTAHTLLCGALQAFTTTQSDEVR